MLLLFFSFFFFRLTLCHRVINGGRGSEKVEMFCCFVSLRGTSLVHIWCTRAQGWLNVVWVPSYFGQPYAGLYVWDWWRWNDMPCFCHRPYRLQRIAVHGTEIAVEWNANCVYIPTPIFNMWDWNRDPVWHHAIFMNLQIPCIWRL